jgi:SPP1 family predicted phage head-tail adaptor
MAFIPTIGQMRMVIKFEIPDKAADNTGGQLEQYNEYYNTRGYFRERRGYQTFSDGQQSMITIQELWCSWRHTLEIAISYDMRIVYESRVFNIDHFSLVDEKRRLYHFDLIEVR